MVLTANETLRLEGFQTGVYLPSSIVGNSFTVIITTIFFVYVLYRSFYYFLYITVCAIFGVEREERNCGCGCGETCDVFQIEDHTIRDRSTRMVCCIHIAGYMFAFVLLGTTFYNPNTTDLCTTQGIMEQVLIWFQLVMFSEYFIWLFIDHFFCANLKESKNFHEKKYWSKFEMKIDEKEFDITDPLYRSNPKSFKYESYSDLVEEKGVEGDKEEKSNKVGEGEFVNESYRRGASFKMKMWYEQDEKCSGSIMICGLEIFGYLFAVLITTIATLIPAKSGMFTSDESILSPRWCWIYAFPDQMYFFYIELFLGMLCIVPISVLMWVRFCTYNHLGKGRRCCSILFCGACEYDDGDFILTKDPQVRVIGVKVIVYSIVFLGWLVSFAHRLAIYINYVGNGRQKMDEDTPLLAILGALQEFQMGSYTGFMVLAFFATNAIMMFCPSCLDIVGICDFGDRLNKWWIERRKWIGGKIRRKELGINSELKYLDCCCCCANNDDDEEEESCVHVKFPTLKSSCYLLLNEFRNSNVV